MSVFESAIGLLAPPFCVGCGDEGETLCQVCSKLLAPFGERCWRCNQLSANCAACQPCRRAGGLSAVFIHTNYEGLAQALVLKYKFGHQRAAAAPIVRLMSGTLTQFISDYNRGYLVVPVPTATKRRRERGFGHTELLAKSIAGKLNLQYSPVLRRHGQTRQLGARREERLIQLASSFSVTGHRQVKGRKVLLIDDVVTTGGTITAAASVLKSAGASRVDALLFAKRL